MINKYWAERAAKAQTALTDKNLIEIEKQMRLYYISSMKKTLGDFENTYYKILQSITDEKEITPADLYKLDAYWQLQAQIKAELQKLGDKEVEYLTKRFVKQFEGVYETLAIPGEAMFNTLDKSVVEQMINNIWVADGKSWSERIWLNTEKLADALNENLIYCLTTGKKPGQLKKLLQTQFNVSFSRADALVRTELAHIQTQAAQKRYTDYGIQEVEVLVDEDERTCPECAKLEGKRYPVNAVMPVPIHPRCRCCMIPVVE